MKAVTNICKVYIFEDVPGCAVRTIYLRHVDKFSAATSISRMFNICIRTVLKKHYKGFIKQ